MADDNRFKPPAEIAEYFRAKRLTPGFSWLDVWGQEHAHAFTVAKSVETELLSTFQSSLTKALDEGQTFETWRDGLRPELQRMGWWGPRMVSDPTGIDPAREVNFASSRRLKTIFQSNMASARAAGQWQRIQRTKRALPYILYVRSSAVEKRAEHEAFVGTILPADDPFWRTHFPPNGWGCKCSVRQISAREARALGYDPDQGGPQIVWRAFRNRRTGEVTRVPEGIDPGWHTNPGLARAKGLTDRLAKQVNDAGPEIADKTVRQLWQSRDRNVLIGLPEPRLSLPAGVSPALSDELGGNGAVVSLFADTARSKTGSRKDTASRKEALDRLPDIIARGEIIDEQKDNHRTLAWKDGERWWIAVAMRAKTGFLRIVSFYQSSEKQVARKRDLYGSRRQ